jgi:hydrogenase maturation protease
MNTTTIYKIAKALLYEGYMLYPYRSSSIKNRQRFNFGVLYPRSYSEQQEGSDSWFTQTECLIAGNRATMLEIRSRFLHLMETSVAGSSNAAPEAVEREIILPVRTLGSLIDQPLAWNASFTGSEPLESASQTGEAAVGANAPGLRPIHASVAVAAHPAMEGLFRITVQTKNAAPAAVNPATRDEALMYSLISAHIMLGAEDGEFVSLLDPPESFRTLAEDCKNIGAFPVLVGDHTQRNMMLSSPIILYDYPEIAPESAGDLFDSTEIDEILSLRVMTLTDAEKNEVRNSGDHARSILERVENLPEEHLLKLHGVLRGLRPLPKETLQ